MPKTKKSKYPASAFIALLTAETLWGISTPLTKLGLESIPIPLFLSIIVLGPALLLLPLALKTWVRLRHKDYALLIIGSVIAITLGNVVLLMGLQRVPSLNVALIGLFGPLILSLL